MNARELLENAEHLYLYKYSMGNFTIGRHERRLQRYRAAIAERLGL